MVYYIINRYTVLYLPERRIKMIYNIGEYIKNRRKVLGITQDELADGICSVMTLSRIERGDQFPHDYTLIQILRGLVCRAVKCFYWLIASSLLSAN